MDTQPQPNETNQPHSSTFQHAPAGALDSPSHLIASIPSALGYYPNESVVLINAFSAPHGSGMLDLGSYLDADVGSTASIQRALQRIPLGRHVGTFAVIVTRVPESSMVAVAAEGLRMAEDEFGDIVEACWIVSEVAEGTPYQLIFGPEPEAARAIWGWDDSYQAGTVTSVVGSEQMRPLIAQGVLPQLHRTEVLAHFEPVSAVDVARCEALASDAYQRGAELMELLTDDAEGLRQAIQRGCSIIAAAPAVCLIDDTGSLIVADVFDNPDDVALIASLLSKSRLRDFLIVDALENPRAAGAVLLTIARNFSGVIRANALCVWAMVAVSLGLNGWASVALECAQEEVPKHSLTNLLISVMEVGRGRSLLELCRQGCAETWGALGE